jgi:N-methylhydantoinase A
MDEAVGVRLRVAFDVGGTFTDVVIAHSQGILSSKPHSPAAAYSGQLSRYKILSLASSIGADVAACIDDALARHADSGVAAIVHGTTVAANTVLEKTGAHTGLITTEGFRDELETRRLGRPGVYDVFWERNPPLIPRRRRLEVRERMRVDGTVDAALDESQVREAARRLGAQGVESVAIAFLHAYANQEHERIATALVREVLPDVAICHSAEVLPEVREYERTSTTALNAYLMPAVGEYLQRLENALAKYGIAIDVMQSNGGVMSAARTRARPVNMIESGPAAGVLAAAALARRLGLAQVVAFDMGGTTAKACLIEDGTPIETAEGEVGAGINLASRLNKGAGYALRVPAFDIAEVGAGGGSIAWVDQAGVLKVGPQSAGAEPGPAAYGRGGDAATITDANVALGYMNPSAIAGGTVSIDARAAQQAIAAVATTLNLPALATAHGIHTVGNATMARAIRAVTTERGRDPREFALIAFGGAGAIHAAALAESLGIGRVCVPLHPGLFSAIGLMMADMRHDFVQSVMLMLDASAKAPLVDALTALEEHARAALDIGELPTSLAVRFAVDLRYARQSSDLTLAISDVNAESLIGDLGELFHDAHAQTYGYARRDEPIEVVSVRARLTAATGQFDFDELAATEQSNGTELMPDAIRDAYFGPHEGTHSARVMTRAAVAAAGDAAEPLAGPIIVEEFDTTVVVPPRWRVHVDFLGNLQLQRGDVG